MVTSSILVSNIVPIDDFIVRRQLRHLNHPMSFFGESLSERRERLSKAIASLSPEEKQDLKQIFENKIVKKIENDETFYYEGHQELIKARNEIAMYSVKQANCRLEMARFNQDIKSPTERAMDHQDLMEKVRQIEDMGTYIDDDLCGTELKTLTSCNVNPNGDLVATSYRSGRCKLWSLPSVEPRVAYESLRSMSNFILFSPKSGSDQLSPDVANLASCAMDGSIALWNLVDEAPVCQLSGPKEWRVTRVRYHPCGSYLASACSDQSWRFYDLTTQSEILHQEGHADAVFDMAFHPDGSLAASAGMDSYGLVWDLRSGHCIHRLEGHIRGIRSIDFSPNGYVIATGGMDNTVKIWDIRKKSLVYTIPAHTNIVTTVMFEKKDGQFLVTSSFDKSVKFWSNNTWANVKSLDFYDDKVTRVDISNNSDLMVSCHFRYLKLWSIKIDKL